MVENSLRVQEMKTVSLQNVSGSLQHQTQSLRLDVNNLWKNSKRTSVPPNTISTTTTTTMASGKSDKSSTKSDMIKTTSMKKQGKPMEATTHPTTTTSSTSTIRKVNTSMFVWVYVCYFKFLSFFSLL